MASDREWAYSRSDQSLWAPAPSPAVVQCFPTVTLFTALVSISDAMLVQYCKNNPFSYWQCTFIELEHGDLTVGQKYFSSLILLITSFEIHLLSSPFMTHKNLPPLVIQGQVEVETKQSRSLAALYKPLSARNCLNSSRHWGRGGKYSGRVNVLTISLETGIV